MQNIEKNGNQQKYCYKNQKNEYVSNKDPNSLDEGMKGIEYHMYKYGIPEMLYEHQDVIDRILDGVKHEEKGTKPDAEMPEEQNPLTLEDFMKSTSFIIATTFVDKIDLFFKMIDADGNGLLSWEEV